MEYIYDAIVILALAVVVGLVIRSMWKGRKKGGGCSGCSGCSGCGCCNSEK